tara:strand:- start:1018 stop:1377 length:360 start_codon:yes stop_codon:yes gene_type:complete
MNSYNTQDSGSAWYKHSDNDPLPAQMDIQQRADHSARPLLPQIISYFKDRIDGAKIVAATGIALCVLSTVGIVAQYHFSEESLRSREEAVKLRDNRDIVLSNRISNSVSNAFREDLKNR